MKRPCSKHGDSMNIRCAECHTYIPACPTCATAPAEFAEGLALWHDSGHARLDRTGVRPGGRFSKGTP